MQESSSSKKKSIEDLDLLDVIQFIWNQKVPILLFSFSGIILGFFFSIIRPDPLPAKQVTLVLNSLPGKDIFSSTINPEKLIEILNTRAGIEAFYEGALAAKTSANAKIIEDMTPEYFRTFLIGLEKSGQNTISVNFALTSNYYFDDFENVVTSGLLSVINEYNQGQNVSYIKLYEDRYDIEKDINILLINVSSKLKSKELSSAERVILTYFRENGTARAKFDLIPVMLNLIPNSDPFRQEMELVSRQLYIRWTLINQQIQTVLEQNRSQIPLPWRQVAFRNKRVIDVENRIAFFTIAFPRIMTGLFLGLALGFVVGAIRTYIENNRVKLREVFASHRVLKSSST